MCNMQLKKIALELCSLGIVSLGKLIMPITLDEIQI